MRILLLDIETSPNTVHVWGLWQQNVSTNQIMASGYTLCWAAKWLGEDEVYFNSVWHTSAKRMVNHLYRLLDEADVVVSYNGIKFDIPTLNKEFLLHGLPPPSPYKQVDLLRTMRGQFRFPSNKLDYVCQQLGLGAKTQHKGHELWIGVMAGSKDDQAVMEEYNKNDVILLEKLYQVLLPWIKNHPNHALYKDEHVACPKCGGKHYQRRGLATTIHGKYQRYQCTSCGGWFRDKKMLIKPPTKQEERFTAV